MYNTKIIIEIQCVTENSGVDLGGLMQHTKKHLSDMRVKARPQRKMKLTKLVSETLNKIDYLEKSDEDEI